ncbi:MAG: MTH1187 family thiamine-binding protein [Candidatus Binatia bacterium]
MLAELSIIPVGNSAHLSGELTKVLKVVHESGLPYQLTPSGTCIEGEWDQLMPLIRQCHERARKASSHVVTLIKLEDDEGEQHKLTRNVASIEEKIGHSLKTTDTRSTTG